MFCLRLFGGFDFIAYVASMKNLFFFLLIFSFPKNSFAQKEKAIKKLNDNLLKIKQKHELLGLSVAVVRKNITVFLGSYGLAHERKKIPLTVNSAYRIASISKSVTATALLMLHDKGLFRLDEDISPTLGFTLRNPRFPTEPITFRQLLNHTSSLRDGGAYHRFLDESLGNKPPLLKDLLSPKGKYYTPDLFSDRKPAEAFEYSNLAYGVIGALVEKLSKQRFDKFCKAKIFQPLGLRASFNVEDISPRNLVTLYRKDGAGKWISQVDDYRTEKLKPRKLQKYKIGSNGLMFSPQGALRISPKELSKLMILYLNKGMIGKKRLLKESTVLEMCKTQWKIGKDNLESQDKLFQAWGLGFHLVQGKAKTDIVFPKKNMIGHFGEAYGLISDFYFDPESQNGFVFMTNGSARPFLKGSKSAYCLLEEDVFEAIKNFLAEY